MLITRKFIAKLAGKRKEAKIDLTVIKSVLLKPISDTIGCAVAHTAHLNQLKSANSRFGDWCYCHREKQRYFCLFRFSGSTA